MATEATVRKFFASSAYAVAGASSNPAKFGHRGKAYLPVRSYMEPRFTHHGLN